MVSYAAPMELVILNASEYLLTCRIQGCFSEIILLRSLGLIPRSLGRSMLFRYPVACGGVVHFFDTIGHKTPFYCKKLFTAP